MDLEKELQRIENYFNKLTISEFENILEKNGIGIILPTIKSEILNDNIYNHQYKSKYIVTNYKCYSTELNMEEAA